ncbi:MAG: response regulator transcription factor [Oscillospiraceae bacterium]|nr:response regulator transcription factor [Oscillospiraceae bacterium]
MQYKKILVVEDDTKLNSSLVMSLNAEGYDTDSAFSVEQALEKYQGVNMIILDVMLPDGTGMDFCRKIRMASSRIPVIFLTSCDDEKDIIKGFDCGADDYITKPFRLNELKMRVNAVYRRCYAEAEESSNLTSLEKSLLDYLMLNKEQFVTRDQILAYLWDSKGNFVNDNTLSVTISRLREKLKNGKIVTRRGMGYKWTQQTNL